MPRIKYFTASEVAEMLSVNVVTVRRWIAMDIVQPGSGIGSIDIVEGGRSDYRISEADLTKFTERRNSRTKAAS